MAHDIIEKQVQLRAPRSRVWRALVDPAEFGAWFGVKLDRPFAPGEVVRGDFSEDLPPQEVFDAGLPILQITPDRAALARAMFEELLELAISRARRHEASVAVVGALAALLDQQPLLRVVLERRPRRASGAAARPVWWA